MGLGRHRWARRLLDLAVYAVGTTVVVAAALLPPSLLAGVGLNGVKFGLFLGGVLAFGYATVLLWPSRPVEDEIGQRDRQGTNPEGAGRGAEPIESRDEVEPREETRFESLVGRVPPLDRYEVAPADRLHPGAKLYVASLLMLAVSYVMEAVFGIRA